MNFDLRGEDILSQVKEQLNKNKIKLWLEPYYNQVDGISDQEELALQQLCDQLVPQLNIDRVLCMNALKDLQNHALDRLNSNKVFKETGTSCLRVKISGEVPRLLSVNILLTANTTQLLEEIGKEIGIDPERIKLISQGKVLLPSESLVSQGVGNASFLMAVILAGNQDLQESDKRFKTLESTKKDVKLLAGRSNANNEYYFQVENQAGEALNLPFYERKALVTAMALHEKGRAALKQGDCSLALVLFLEADKEYSECTSELLKAVDNYALLHLDISWCYLCLRNPVQIPDAERRLSLCEQSFHKTYGPNLERLMAIKGATGNEAALFMRLHLMQGVVMFHKNKRAEARLLLERAQSELSGLKFDDNKLCLLLELGYSNAEARLGLRAARGNIEEAEELICRKRKERELAREKNRVQLKNERERITLGLCADGKQYCEPSLLDRLVTMGFNRSQSVEALKLSNNMIVEAIRIIQEQPHLLPSSSCALSEECVAQVASLGFEPELAREALMKCPELERAVKSLNNLSQSSQGIASEAVAAASASAMSFLEDFHKKRKTKMEEEKRAFERVSEGLLENDLTDDHLDLSLAQEEQFLMEYLSLLN
uniref:UBA domain-containing protein n=1 Tax=Graphocephala atropunctata TaxID=36148 RepID=A0A1B6L3Y2_9HEMI